MNRLDPALWYCTEDSVSGKQTSIVQNRKIEEEKELREAGRGGGTGLLRWCFTPLSLSHLNISSFEFHVVTVTSPINLLIVVIYCPPGPLGAFLEEMDMLLSLFPTDSTPLTVLGDFNLPADKLQSSCLLPLLHSFSLTFNSCPPTHKGGNTLDLVFSCPFPATDSTSPHQCYPTPHL
ncbi:hypothetical protein PGIGA_G00214610 [Pangasianodon gigas]|uniref:Uncharacterized protein n=1 Tax=Pangasianodon gigas TaxID=30993 RepID=A0ACC5WGU9_PANGG|nr:hypothetical protein [Pangasianodon gigas]